MTTTWQYPLRLRVMMALTSLLEAISVDSNSAPDAPQYQNDLSGRVFRGRNLFGDGDPVPMIAILETPIANDQIPPPEESQESSGPWDISIQGFCKEDKINPTDPAYLLAADVIMALAAEKERPAAERKRYGRVMTPLLGVYGANGKGAVTDIIIGSPVCRPPDEISGKAYFWLQVTIKLVEDLERPYD